MTLSNNHQPLISRFLYCKIISASKAVPGKQDYCVIVGIHVLWLTDPATNLPLLWSLIHPERMDSNRVAEHGDRPIEIGAVHTGTSLRWQNHSERKPGIVKSERRRNDPHEAFMKYCIFGRYKIL